MKTKISQWAVILMLLLNACQTEKVDDKTFVSIATAANVQFAMDSLTAVFTKETGIACEVILSSSGKLTTQIVEGAPYDLFVSADLSYPKMLYEKGLTTAPPVVYAVGKLVIWSNDLSLSSLQSIDNQSITHIAIANPKTAPYGVAAVQSLQKVGLYEALQPRFVYGESIAQTNQFITSGAAQVGFTAKSVVISPELAGKGSWVEVPTDLYEPIEQGVVLLKKRSKNANKFYNFLLSEKGKKILTTFGYGIPE